MRFLKKPFIALLILFGLITFSNAETSWITKKKDKIKINSFCIQKSEKSSFGFAVTVFNKSSICDGEDLKVTKSDNAELFKYLVSRYNGGVFFIKETVLSKYDKEDKTTLVAKNNSSNSWIKKKEIKEKKKELKEKIEESKSWITKKSKKEEVEIKSNLKIHKRIGNLPKSEFYFTAKVEPNSEKEEAIYIYGYFNPSKEFDVFEFKNKKYTTINSGIAFFENKKNSCEVNVKQDTKFNLFLREISLKCKNYNIEGSIALKDITGNADGGVATGGNNVIFEINTTKEANASSLAKLKQKKLPRTMLANQNEYDDNLLDLEIRGKYYALLIGNSNYEKYAQWASLNSPKNDVMAISKILKNKYKFEKVITAIDVTKKEIEEKLNELAEITTDNDYVLIYYSGHGEKKSNSTYWIPIDGPKKWKYGSWVSISEVGNFIENIQAHHLVLMVDSCYTGSSFKGTNESDLSTKSYDHFKHLAQKLLDRRARYVLSSGGNEPVDDSFDGKHSIFAKSFINSLEKADVINMESIYRRIDMAHGQMDQRPYLYSPEMWGHGGGDFIFVAKNK